MRGAFLFVIVGAGLLGCDAEPEAQSARTAAEAADALPTPDGFNPTSPPTTPKPKPSASPLAAATSEPTPKPTPKKYSADWKGVFGNSPRRRRLTIAGPAR